MLRELDTPPGIPGYLIQLGWGVGTVTPPVTGDANCGIPQLPDLECLNIGHSGSPRLDDLSRVGPGLPPEPRADWLSPPGGYGAACCFPPTPPQGDGNEHRSPPAPAMGANPHTGARGGKNVGFRKQVSAQNTNTKMFIQKYSIL
jgi:hypothetical protein